MEPRERGAQAQMIAGSEVFKDAVAATQDWAMRTFRAAENPDEAWNARLRLKATEELVAYMLAVIQLGRSEADKLVAKHDAQSEKKKERENVVEYLEKARKARADYLEINEKVANQQE